jgi:polysaccharide export outer membrane protein
MLFVGLMSVGFCLTVLTLAASQSPSPSAPKSVGGASIPTVPSYVLGPDDVISIKAQDAEELSSASIRIDPTGRISLPMVGRVTAGGLTVEAFEKELSARLKTYVREPVVAVSVVEYRSQPVSVLGAVGQAGVHQLEGRKTLVEILAKAGGLSPEAGSVVKITRKAEWGPIPLSSVVADPSGQFSVAQVNLKGIMQATSPEDNILILPNDVISVPRADLVYVIGEVKKPGGFILRERGSISGLQALAMAEGLTGSAAAQSAMIIRRSPSTPKPVEIRANMSEILKGKRNDIELLPDDILFIPTAAAKNAMARAVGTALSAATSALIYGTIF